MADTILHGKRKGAHISSPSTGGGLHMSHFDQPFRGLPRELRDMIWSELLDYRRLRMRRVNRVIVHVLGDNLTAAPFSGYADENHIHGRSGLAIDLSILLANKQTFEEAGPIFYGLNEFIIPIASLIRADPREVRVGPWMRRIALEGSRLPDRPPPLCLVNCLSTFQNLTTISVSMPREPEIECHARREDAIPFVVLVYLIRYLSSGVFKHLRLVYPISDCTNYENGPDQFKTIKVIRRMGPGPLTTQTTENRARWLDVARSWNGVNLNMYSNILIGNGPQSLYDFTARFEDVALANNGNKHTVVLLTRTQDEPVKAERVDRPKVQIQLPPRPLKRKRFRCDVGLEYRPTKIICLPPLSARARCIHPSIATARFRAAGSPFADTLYQRKMNHLSLLFQDLTMKG